jgi:sterol desaturase/sphingolipid hydroxylase (fatty acid hydroxylase superfamily)
MNLSLTERSIILLSCGLLVILMSFHLKPKRYYIFIALLFISTLITSFGRNIDFFSIWQFSLFWMIVGIERIFPRNSYEVASKENIKSICFISIRQLAATAVIVQMKTGILFWNKYSLHWAQKEIPLWVQVATFILVADFIIYLLHRAQHRFSWYWSFHKLHHASKELTAFANFRTHIIEFAVVQVGSRMLLFRILGLSNEVLLYGNFIASTISGIVSHANIDWPKQRFKWLNYLIVTPNSHALHHSKFGKSVNFSETFPIWDLLFGTFSMPRNNVQIEFGIEDQKYTEENGFRQHLESFFGKREL